MIVEKTETDFSPDQTLDSKIIANNLMSSPNVSRILREEFQNTEKKELWTTSPSMNLSEIKVTE